MTLGLTLASAVRMVYWIHDRSSNRWTTTAMSVTTRLSKGDDLVLGIAELSDGRTTLDPDQSHLSRWESQLGVAAFLGHQLSRSAR